MGWKRRLLELALAGGLGSGVSCGGVGVGVPQCNANPDPCCRDDGSAACQSRRACIAHPTDACCAEGNNRFAISGCAPDGGLADGG
jgi:hypothetical protein